MMILSSKQQLSRVASQINALAKPKTQFLQAPAPSRNQNQFFSIPRRSENSLANSQNNKLKLSLILISFLFVQNSFAYNSHVISGNLQLNQVYLDGTTGKYMIVEAIFSKSYSTWNDCEYGCYNPGYIGATWLYNQTGVYDDGYARDIGDTNFAQCSYEYPSGYKHASCSYSNVTIKPYIPNQCPSGTVIHQDGICRVNVLSDYDKDPAGCDKFGGYYYAAFGIESGGSYKTIPLPFGSIADLKSHFAYSTHCGTFTAMAGEVAANILPMLQMVFPLFRSSKLAKLARYAFSQDMQTKLLTNPNRTAKNDYSIKLPKLPAPASPSMKATVPIVEKPIETVLGSDGVYRPTREPEAIPDKKYEYIADEYIPETTAGDPIVDYATVDRFNNLAKATSVETPLTELIPEVGTSTLPVKETFDFSKILQNSEIPADIASVPATTTKSVTFDGADPIDTYVTTKNYPDGSSLSQTVKINRATKQGSVSSTTLAQTGESTSLHFPINVPTYNGVLSGSDIIKAPTNQTFNSVTNTSTNTTNTVTPSVTPPATTTPKPDEISGQDYTSLINAKMPNYKYQEHEDITLFKVDSINELNTNFKDMFENITTQLSTAKTTFDTTKELISGGWQPPIIPPGSCGQFMSFDFHGKHVDLCPPMAQQTAKIAPLVTLLLTLAGMALAVRIYITALKD